MKIGRRPLEQSVVGISSPDPVVTRSIHPDVGRKNHYGSKSRRGTEVAATFNALVETASSTA
jgi:hypothetical protein